MPPKKPGFIVEFTAEKYGNIPDAPPLRNGHVLHIFFQQNRSVPHTVKEIYKIVGTNYVVKAVQIHKLLSKTIKKYTKFSRESDRQHFQDVCDQVFTLHTLAQPSSHKAPSVSGESQLSHPSTSQFEVSSPAIMTLSPLTVSELSAGEESCTSSTQSPAVSVRTSPRIALTPEFQRIQRRLSFAVMTKSDMKKKYRDSVKSLQEKLKSSRVQQVKYLNQDIKRKKKIIAKKSEMIRLLRKEIKSGPGMEQLDSLRKQLSYEKKKNLQLKKYRKCKKVAETSASAESDDSRGLIAAKTVNVQSQRIRELENENLVLQENVESLTNRQHQIFVREGKIYPFDLRMVVYDNILNNVPTSSIPILIQKLAQRAGFTLDTVPNKSTVEQMIRELGVVSDFQVAEFLLSNQDLTLGFDATTQEGVHVNEIHFTSASDCLIMSLDLMPGGTAEDYQLHIQESLSRVAGVYTKIYDCNFESIRKTMIANIKNTLTDRSAVNHATISQLEEAWGVSFNELNCHLHPLETIARTCRSTLKDAETVRGSLSGNDCIAGNIVLAVNKFRYKDGKGDPRGFVSFLEKSGLPKGLLPRYRGNRLHVLFVICEQLIYHYDLFLDFFSTGTVSCRDLQSALLSDFGSATGKVEMQVLGLIGIFLSGPWMSKFYTAAATQTVSHVDGIETVRNVIETIKTFVEVPLETLVLKKDVFGGELQALSVQKLQMEPADRSLFATMMSACLAQIVVALERQYSRYFKLDINEVLRKETESARCHNIDAEAVMGMFSAAKSRAPNATLSFISSKIRAKKNRTCDYLDNLDVEKKKKLLNVSVSLARKQRCVVQKKCFEIRDEIIRRIAVKTQKRASSDKNKLKTAPKNPKLNLSKDFPHIQYVSQLQQWRSGTGSEPKAVSPGLSTDVQRVLNTSLPAQRSAIQRLKSAQENSDLNEIRRAVTEIYQLVEEAKVLPSVGRQVAEEICNRIRLDGGLELLLLQLQKTPEVEIIYESAKLLEQILTSENR
uniref:Uncharacterized protein n=1 Tax=Oryzias sinensis TaxID=183150 RepID=A0A8C7YFM4_9TELE